MAYFAQLNDNNRVTGVFIVGDEYCGEGDFLAREQEGMTQCVAENGPGTYKITCKQNRFRGRYAGIGMEYDATLDEFIFPQPFASWVLNEQGSWDPPTQMPNDETKRHIWNEETQEWVSVPWPMNPEFFTFG